MRSNRHRRGNGACVRSSKCLLFGFLGALTVSLLLVAKRAFQNFRSESIVPLYANIGLPVTGVRDRERVQAQLPSASAAAASATASRSPFPAAQLSQTPPQSIRLPPRGGSPVIQPKQVSSTGSAPPATGIRVGSTTASAFKTLAQILYDTHPVLAYSNRSLGLYRVVLSTQWFGGPHPAYTTAAGSTNVCPASGCSVHLAHSPLGLQPWTDKDTETHRLAHMLLYHADAWDFTQPGHLDVDDIRSYPTSPVHSVGGRPLGVAYRQTAVLAGENFNMHEGRIPFELFTTEMSFRPLSFVRESYILYSLSEYARQGTGVVVPAGRTWDMQARVWEDLWPAPLPWEDRKKDVQATWASHYCTATASGREDFVEALLDGGLSILILGDTGNCLRNAPPALLQMSREEQSAEMRKHMFHLAFENARVTGYVTEKFYWALVRGQVPVVWGAPDIARHAPGPWSYIDASLYKDNVKELIVLLKTVSRNKSMYERYHAWRRERSFEEYGDILKAELAEMLWLANASTSEEQRYQCRLCHGLRRFEHRGGFREPPAAGGVQHMGNDCLPRFSNPMRPM